MLGVRVPEGIQMKGFRVKIGPNLDMEVPDVVQSAGGYRGSTAPQRPSCRTDTRVAAPFTVGFVGVTGAQEGSQGATAS